MAKTFATYEQQIEKLGNDGLLIEDAPYAEEQLRNIGYFALINGYKGLLTRPFYPKYKKAPRSPTWSHSTTSTSRCVNCSSATDVRRTQNEKRGIVFLLL